METEQDEIMPANETECPESLELITKVPLEEVDVDQGDSSSVPKDEPKDPPSVNSEGTDTLEPTTSDASSSSATQTSSLPPSSSRLMRNLAEKMRRDKLNMYISELSSLVPIVAMATKRMDKTSVLRLSANFLRIHLSLKQGKAIEGKPKIAPEGIEASLSTALLEAIEGFMLIVTSLGKIVYISDSVEKLLGHSQLDLMGQSLYTVCHNGDHELLRHHLQPSSQFDSKDKEHESPDYIARSPSFFGGKPEEALGGLASGERRSFYVRLAERSMARGDPARHVTVHLIGYLRPPNNKKDNSKTSKGKKECSSTTSNGDEHLLVCVARPFRNKGITELSWMEAVQDEYITRHLPDGRITYSDHRIAFVAGYLTEEVTGLSAFDYIHKEDLAWATVANRQMFSSVEGQGYSVYRLQSKTGSLIYLRTRGFLEFNKSTQKVETFVCINTLLTPEEGEKELQKERERITPFITFQQVTTTSSTNMSSSGSGTAQLPIGTVSTSLPLSNKIVSTISLKHRKDKPLSLPPALTSESMATPNPGLGSDFSCVPGSSIDGKSVISPLELVPISAISSDIRINGESLETSAGSIQLPVATGLSPGHTSSSIVSVDSLESFDDLNCKTPPVIPSASQDSSDPIEIPRLKRSFTEVEDFVTPNAKRPIVPATYISSYTSLHHTTHMRPKWSPDTNSTIVFDQHNNNG